MPRTGSKYLYGVLLNVLGDEALLFHTHGMSERRIQSVLKHGHGGEKDRRTVEKSLSFLRNLRSSLESYVFIPCRDPVARVYSAFLLESLGKGRDLRRDYRPETGTFSAPLALQSEFTDFARQQLAYQGNWFRTEVESIFGCAIQRIDSPASRGYSIAEMEGARLVFLRTEDMTRCLEEGLFSHCPVKEERRYENHGDKRILKYGVGRLNSAEELDMKDVYDALKRSIPLPDEIVAAFHGLPEVKWLYAPAGIEGRPSS
jgi:hypothetical protein